MADNLALADSIAERARSTADSANTEGMVALAQVYALLAIRAELRALGDAIYSSHGGMV